MAICKHDIFEWKSERRTLVLLLFLYASVFLIEFLFYLFSKSSLVLAESLHILSDSFIYIFALASSYQILKTQIFWSKIIGFFQIALGLWVLVASLYHYIFFHPSNYHFVIWTGLLSLAANTISLFLVSEYKEKTLYFKVSWIFLRNDFFIKFLVLCSGVIMEYWPSKFINLAVSVFIGFILIASGKSILKQVFNKTKLLK